MKTKNLLDFPKFRPLKLEDRGILQPYFSKLQPEISDRCFTNLFIWRNFYDIQISRFKSNICILCASKTTPEKEFFFPPLGQNNLLECIEACFDYMLSQNMKPIIRRASEDFVCKHLNAFDKYIIKEDLNISDYIYRSEDIINLRGRRYHGQRNYIKRFKKMYPGYTTEFLSRENISECIRFSDEWLENKLESFKRKFDIHSFNLPDEVAYLKAESETTRRILLNFNRLELSGLAVRIDGDIRAFTVGEKLNCQMALIHIEKSDHSYLGLSQFLSQNFCQQAWSDCEYVNRMEDLGVKGLRKSKLALGPHYMAKKYNIEV